MPALRLYNPDQSGPPPAAPADPLNWTLAELYSEYYSPAALTSRAARPETRRAYCDALAYWQRLTDDPPLRRLTSLTLARFAEALETAEPLRHRTQKKRATLATTTRHRILRTLRALLRSAGTDSSRGPALAAITAAPYVPLPRLRPQPAPAPSVASLARLFATVSPRWRVALAVLFYTGLRPGAVFRLTGADLDLAAPAWAVRAETNTKTGKPYAAPMHPAAARAIRELHPAGLDRAALLLDWQASPGTIRADFRRQLEAAGLAPFRLRDIRRTHAAAIAATGIEAAATAAQLALQHRDQRTTANHYLAVGPLLLALPNLYPEETPPRG